ncbi:shikimate dehydrogenase, partial [Streptomyces anulatus]
MADIRRRAAVLGSPIAHSLSPVLHRAAYAELGLDDWSYDRFEVDEAALPGFVAGLDASWAGLSLTMPLKRAIIPLLDEISATAASVEAVNTVVFTEDRRRVGDNTANPRKIAAQRER